MAVPLQQQQSDTRDLARGIPEDQYSGVYAVLDKDGKPVSGTEMKISPGELNKHAPSTFAAAAKAQGLRFVRAYSKEDADALKKAEEEAQDSVARKMQANQSSDEDTLARLERLLANKPQGGK